MAFTLPLCWPANTKSPTRSVPPWTRIVETYPRPLSRNASTTVPLAIFVGLALSSSNSASSNTFSSSSETPCPVFAEISWDCTLPPQSSTRRFIPARPSLILSGLAFGRSILLIAKTIGTPAAWACAMASFVWGIMSSSAAITIMARSVTWAPRARMAVNASWPGVSRKVIFWPSGNVTP